MSFIPQGVPFTSLPTALRGTLQPNQLAVLWVIQTYAGANADCWPSIKTIADGACVSVRTARAVAGQLESMGLLQRESRRNDRGDCCTNLYRVTVNHLANVAPPSLDPPAARAVPPGIKCPTPRQMVPDPPAGDAAELNTRELNTEELQTASKAAKGRKPARNDYSDEFQAFWQQYQKIGNRATGQSKPKAWAEYKKLTRGVQKRLQGALAASLKDQARGEQKGRFLTCYPDCFRWLRDGRYESFLETATAAPAKPSHLTHPGAQEGDPF